MIVFIDEILVYSRSKEEHMKHLRIVLQNLREHRLFAKFSKCEFRLKSVTLLGDVVSKDKIMVNPTRLKVIPGWTRPTSPSNVRSFNSLVGYYR